MALLTSAFPESMQPLKSEQPGKSMYMRTQASPFFDRLVFSKIKQRMGGKVRALVSGAAPLAPHVRPTSLQAIAADRQPCVAGGCLACSSPCELHCLPASEPGMRPTQLPLTP